MAASALSNRRKNEMFQKPSKVAENDYQENAKFYDYSSPERNLTRSIDKLKTAYSFRSNIDKIERLSVIQERGQVSYSRQEFFKETRERQQQFLEDFHIKLVGESKKQSSPIQTNPILVTRSSTKLDSDNRRPRYNI